MHLQNNHNLHFLRGFCKNEPSSSDSYLPQPVKERKAAEPPEQALKMKAPMMKVLMMNAQHMMKAQVTTVLKIKNKILHLP
jgi:hypothetical protein